MKATGSTPAGSSQSPRIGRGCGRSIQAAARSARQIECLRRIADGAGSEVPFLQTVFSPLAQAKNLAGQERLIVHLRQSPDAGAGRAAGDCRDDPALPRGGEGDGDCGHLLCGQLANYGLLSEAEYREFGEPYDRRILREAGDLLVQHGPPARPGRDVRPGGGVSRAGAELARPRVRAVAARRGRLRFGGAVCGGLEHWEHLLRGEPDQIRRLVADAIAQTGGRRLIVSSGCVAPVNAPFSNLRAVRQAVEDAPGVRGINHKDTRTQSRAELRLRRLRVPLRLRAFVVRGTHG